MLKELSNKDKLTLKLFGPFANHPAYDYLVEMAFKVDPKKSMSDKGKTLFPTNK